MEVEEMEVVVLDGLIATDLNLPGGGFDLGFDFFPLGICESEEVVEAVDGAPFPGCGVFIGISGEGEGWGEIPAFFFSQEVSDSVSAEEDGEEGHEDGEVVAKAGFHGAEGLVGGSGWMMGPWDGASSRRKRKMARKMRPARMAARRDHLRQVRASMRAWTRWRSDLMLGWGGGGGSLWSPTVLVASTRRFHGSSGWFMTGDLGVGVF